MELLNMKMCIKFNELDNHQMHTNNNNNNGNGYRGKNNRNRNQNNNRNRDTNRNMPTNDYKKKYNNNNCHTCRPCRPNSSDNIVEKPRYKSTNPMDTLVNNQKTNPRDFAIPFPFPTDISKTSSILDKLKSNPQFSEPTIIISVDDINPMINSSKSSKSSKQDRRLSNQSSKNSPLNPLNPLGPLGPLGLLGSLVSVLNGGKHKKTNSDEDNYDNNDSEEKIDEYGSDTEVEEVNMEINSIKDIIKLADYYEELKNKTSNKYQ